MVAPVIPPSFSIVTVLCSPDDWSLLHDTIAVCRQRRPHLFENFEWLAARAARWRQAHPGGDYPPGERRMIDRPTMLEEFGER